MTTPRELQTHILSVIECAPYVQTNEMPKISGSVVRAKDQAIANILNAAGSFKRLNTRMIGIGTVLDTLGADTGAAVLDGLYAAASADRALFYALKLLERGELDVSLSSTRAKMDALLPTGIAAALKALAETPETISAAQVSVALRGPWGDE